MKMCERLYPNYITDEKYYNRPGIDHFIWLRQ